VTSHIWNHTIFVLFCPAYLTEHNVSKVHPCCGMYHDFMYFYDLDKSPLYIHNTFSLSVHLLMDTCFHLLAVVSKSAMNSGIQVPSQVFGYRSGVARSYGNSMLKFLRNCQTVLKHLHNHTPILCDNNIKTVIVAITIMLIRMPNFYRSAPLCQHLI